MDDYIYTAFLDTNILWDDFLQFLSARKTKLSRWYYDICNAVTSTKCVYELYMLGKSIKKCSPDKLGHFLYELLPFLSVDTMRKRNQQKLAWYDTVTYSLSNIEQISSEYNLQLPKAMKKKVLALQNFFHDFIRFRDSIQEFLTLHSVFEITYPATYTSQLFLELFGDLSSNNEAFWHLHIPNEDFEIVIAAIAHRSTFFVSRDKQLGNAWGSIGLNLPYPQYCLLPNDHRISLDRLVELGCCASIMPDSFWMNCLIEYSQSCKDPTLLIASNS